MEFGKKCVRKRHLSNLSYYPGTCLDRQRKNLSQDLLPLNQICTRVDALRPKWCGSKMHISPHFISFVYHMLSYFPTSLQFTSRFCHKSTAQNWWGKRNAWFTSATEELETMRNENSQRTLMNSWRKLIFLFFETQSHLTHQENGLYKNHPCL